MAERLGGTPTFRLKRSNHGEAIVWEARAGGRRAFLKLHGSPGKASREREVYRRWVDGLERAPRLIGLDPTGHALLLTAVPGEMVEGAAHPRDTETALFRQAGAFARALHRQPVHRPDPVPLVTAYAQRMQTWLERGRAHVDGGVIQALDSRFDPATVSDHERVPAHRDYTPRNWLWAPKTGRLSVVDFGQARPDLWLADLVKLRYGVWSGRPELEAAFLQGYGRELDDGDRAVLQTLGLLHGISTLVWALRHGDHAYVNLGVQILRRAGVDASAHRAPQ